MKNFLVKYSFFFHLVGALAGVFVCLIFVALDINQLGIEFNATNILEIFSNQYAYIFSFVFFPIISLIISFLMVDSIKHNQKLATQKRFADNLLDSIGKPIFICNQQLEIVYSNLCFKSLFDCDMVDDLFQNHNTKLIEDIKNGQEFVNQEISINLGKDHDSIYYINCSRFLEMEYESDTVEPRLILNMQDVTSIKKSEILIQEKDALIRTHAHLSALGEMAAGFAHEINNPLAIICANNYILKKLTTKDEVNTERFIKALDDNEVTINRITKIISSLRALARDKEGETLAHMALAPSLEEALNLCQIKINNTYVKFMAELNGIEHRIVSIRKLQFAQVLVNLLNNAIDAVKEQTDPQTGRHNGWVKLILEENDSTVFIRIIDSGSGIPKDIQDKIFEPLFTTKDIGEGTGLGLSLCQKMIDEHQGTLELNNSSPNTEFVISLPKSLSNQEPEVA